MERELLDRVSPIVVIGYGAMGEIYVQELLAAGLPPQQLIVVDRDEERRAKCLAKHENLMNVSANFMDVRGLQPKTAFVLTNSPEHLGTIRPCLDAGVQWMFVEKPLVLTSQVGDLLSIVHTHRLGLEGLYTAYLIPFSGAVQALKKKMADEGLAVYHVDARWGKNRLKDRQQRPTAGDAEDETVHPVSVALDLLRVGRHPALSFPVTMIRADLVHFPFFDPQVQEAARQHDMSYPVRPESGTNLRMEVLANHGPVKVWVQSSFLSFDLERRIEVVLGPTEGGDPTVLARLEFDVEGKEDRLVLYHLKGNQDVSGKPFPAKAKLGAQLEAFLHKVAGGKDDDRLVNWSRAVHLVRIMAAALKSAQQNSLEVVQ
jgi:predicted dehydrogenase